MKNWMGRILFRGLFRTKPFYVWNQLFLWKKGNFYLKMVIKSLLENNNNLTTDHSLPYSGNLYKTPNIGVQIKYIFYCINFLSKKFVKRKILKLDYRFGVSYAFCNWNKLVMRKAKKIDSPRGHFLADPFVISNNNNNFIFLEDYSFKNKKGVINVYQVNENHYKCLGTVLEEEFHLSYPFVFKFKNKFFMVPESHKKFHKII